MSAYVRAWSANEWTKRPTPLRGDGPARSAVGHTFVSRVLPRALRSVGVDFQDKGSGGARSRIVVAVLAWILFGAGMIALVTSIRTGPLARLTNRGRARCVTLRE